MKKLEFGIQALPKYCNEVLILSCLFKAKKHGYQIALEIEEKSEGLFKLNYGTLYPILHKLEKEGMIKGVWKHEGPKRKRKYYSITSQGKKYALQQVESWDQFYASLSVFTGDIRP